MEKDNSALIFERKKARGDAFMGKVHSKAAEGHSSPKSFGKVLFKDQKSEQIVGTKFGASHDKVNLPCSQHLDQESELTSTRKPLVLLMGFTPRSVAYFLIHMTHFNVSF